MLIMLYITLNRTCYFSFWWPHFCVLCASDEQQCSHIVDPCIYFSLSLSRAMSFLFPLYTVVQFSLCVPNSHAGPYRQYRCECMHVMGNLPRTDDSPSQSCGMPCNSSTENACKRKKKRDAVSVFYDVRYTYFLHNISLQFMKCERDKLQHTMGTLEAL